MNPRNSIRLSLQSLLRSKDHLNEYGNVIALTGSRFLHQKTLVRELLSEEVNELDFIEMESGVDGAREAVKFAESKPLNGDIKVIFVDNADRLSEPAQDAILKISESPPDSLIIILIAYDSGLLQPALSSRIRTELRFLPFSKEEMYEYSSSLAIPTSDVAIDMACGLPELYSLLIEKPDYEDLHNTIISVVKLEHSILSKPPKIISDLENGNNQIRDAVIHVIRNACKLHVDKKRAVIHVLKFCGILSNSSSANTEIHWMRMISDIQCNL